MKYIFSSLAVWFRT